ncbi:hypothetical protein CBR_g38 [Chara braunii]|uniref:Uncharacterized protein n=1 Tax=Chara braunii TaxID=69332 RepID=A0A388JLE1_CHABU|nr:hypothetical protein CBR_g38 [Chara braunii]|eukprot:GBG58639.1 hypothetical protein CBR_g38 [Chara braunii]
MMVDEMRVGLVWRGMLDDCVMAEVEGLGRRGVGVTTVGKVVDDDECVRDVLVGGVDVEGGRVKVKAEACSEEEVGCGVEDEVVCGAEEEGAVVVTTVMAGEFPSIAATRPEMVDMVVFMLAMDDWREASAWRMVVRSGAAVVVAGWSPVRSRAMLSTELVRMADMSMLEDWAMVGEGGPTKWP